MAGETRIHDVAVVGLGAAGSATLRSLARAGVDAIGIDRFSPPHDRGSSHGETRITRRAIGEGEALVPLAMRSHELWRELEAETGSALLHEVGCLLLSRADDDVARPGRTGFIQRTLDAARRFAIPHELLDSSEIRARFPQFSPASGECGYFEPGGGYLAVEACVSAQLRSARHHGAALRLETMVHAITDKATHVRLDTSSGVILADRVAVAAGGWTAGLLGAPFDRLLEVTRQVMFWFPVAAQHDAWGDGPVFIWPHGDSAEDFFYGFPTLSGEASIKTAGENYRRSAGPDEIDRAIAPHEAQEMFARHLAGRVNGIGADPVRAVTCFYTATPDSMFLIDAHPASDRILVVSPCSGHGLKHSAAIGEAVAALIEGRTPRMSLDAFRLDRFREVEQAVSGTKAS